MKPILVARHLLVQYQNSSEWVLDDVNIDVFKGKLTAVIGPSGCGKSTLIHTLCGLIPHSIPSVYKGDVLLGDQQIAELDSSEIATKIAYVGQNPDATVIMPEVKQEVCFAIQNLNYPSKEVIKRAKDAIEKVGLSSYWNINPWILSGGQRQRLALACALAMEPEILILDEPTSMIDPIARFEFYEYVRFLIKKNVAVVLIDHDLDPILDQVDQILALDKDGKKIALGDPRTVYYEHLETLRKEGVWLPRAVCDCFMCMDTHEMIMKQNYEQFPLTCKQANISLPKLKDWILPNKTAYYNIDQIKEKIQIKRDEDLTVYEDIKQSSSITNNIEEKPSKWTLKLKDFGIKKRSPHINMTIHSGELVAICGANGTGKSSILEGIAGFISKRKIDGEATLYKDGVKTKLSCGYVFQNPAHQFIKSTVEKELQVGKTNQKTVDQLLKQFHLEDKREVHPQMLSGGQQRRLSVATMVGHLEEVILLDEPTYGQDCHNTVELMSFIQALVKMGKIVIFATHDLELATKYATTIVALPDCDKKQVDERLKPYLIKEKTSLFNLHPFTLFLASLSWVAIIFILGNTSINIGILIGSICLICLSKVGLKKIVWTLCSLGGLFLFLSLVIHNFKGSGEMFLPDHGETPLELALEITVMIAIFVAGAINVPAEATIRECTRLLKLPYKVSMAGIVSLVMVKRFHVDFHMLRKVRALRKDKQNAFILAPALRWISSILALLIQSIRHVEQVSISMDSRAFGAYETRTELQTERWRKRDTIVLSMSLIVSCLILFVK